MLNCSFNAFLSVILIFFFLKIDQFYSTLGIYENYQALFIYLFIYLFIFYL